MYNKDLNEVSPPRHTHRSMIVEREETPKFESISPDYKVGVSPSNVRAEL
jgi:hypothetical protein